MSVSLSVCYYYYYYYWFASSMLQRRAQPTSLNSPAVPRFVHKNTKGAPKTRKPRASQAVCAPLRLKLAAERIMPMSCGAAASTTPRTRGPRRRGGAVPSAEDPPLAVGGPGGTEEPQRLDQQVTEMNESYARKLRQFMAERASERLQSHRRVVQLEEALEGAIAARQQPTRTLGAHDG